MSLAVIPAGFFTSAPVQTAALVGGGAAIVSGVIGVFTILRGQSFAGHALADVSSAGGAASFLLGVTPMLGFLGMAVLSAGVLEVLGLRASRERELATGIVLGAGLGLTALFLFFDVTTGSTTGAAISVMFGSMFAIPAAIIPFAAAIGAAALALTALIYRPLLLSSLDPVLAEVQGVNIRAIGLVHLLVLSLAVTLSAMTIGAILSTALLIGPAAAALRLARGPGAAVLLAVGIGVGCVLLGLLLAYDSFYWTPGHGWPVSFFIVSLIFAAYLLSGFAAKKEPLF
jgi:zinc/manganese transport system permease protein